MVQIHPDPPILRSLNYHEGSFALANFALEIIQSTQNYILLLSYADEKCNYHPAKTLTQDFFRYARRASDEEGACIGM